MPEQKQTATRANGADDGVQVPRVVLSASIAYDLIMTFPGSFKDYVLPDKAHVLSVSFLFDSLRRHRGGIGGNIAYSLALLGERSMVVGAGGSDFHDYRATFDQMGIDTSQVLHADDLLTGSSFMMTDLTGNQIAGFYPGASERAGTISVAPFGRRATFGLVGATALDAMRRHAEEFSAAGCRLIYDPSQQVVAMPAEDLNAGLERAWAVIGSDYEFAIMAQKTGRDVASISQTVPLVVVTYGDKGSVIHYEGARYEIPIAVAEPVADPTGGGDAYRAGLIKGMLLGLDWPIAGRMGALSATYAIEHHGTQEHTYTGDAFVQRWDRVFEDHAGALKPEWFRRLPPISQEAVAAT